MHPSELHDLAMFILEHGLHPSGAEQTACGLGMDHRTVFDLAPAGTCQESFELGVDDDGGPIGVRIGSDPGRAERHERIGTLRVLGG